MDDAERKRSYDHHRAEQRRAWLALSARERLAWLEDAKRFASVAIAAARKRAGSKATGGVAEKHDENDRLTHASRGRIPPSASCAQANGKSPATASRAALEPEA